MYQTRNTLFFLNDHVPDGNTIEFTVEQNCCL